MSELIALLKGVVDDFSWKKARTLVAVAGVLAIAFFSYDRYSDHTRLSRLKQLADVAKILDEIDKEKSTALQYAKQQLNAELKDQALSAPSFSGDIDSAKRWFIELPWRRFVYSIMLLGPYLAFTFITDYKTDKRFAITFTLIFLALTGCLGLLIPETHFWPYSHAIGTPLLAFILLALFIFLLSDENKNSEKIAAHVNATTPPPPK